MNKFKVGDRVKSVGNIPDLPLGSLGNVTCLNLRSMYPYDVAFDYDNSPMEWPMKEEELDYAT